MNVSMKLLKGFLVGAGLLVSANASALPIGLGLVLDESGSISSANWDLQRNAYASVLNSALIPTDGSLVVGVWKFDDTVEQVFAPTLIDSAAAKNSLIAAINGMAQGAGLTAIGDAVTEAQNALIAYGLGNLSKAVIDVSTDGANNTGSDPIVASNAAIAAGIDQVNCLGIGAAASCSWNPASSLDFTANTFNDFENTLKVKIARETGQVPEPATLALLGAGLFGLSVTRRRKA